jgi:ribA/ribD-fused uncharacterized protein
MPDVIDKFVGEYSFLSNFYNSPMKLDLGEVGLFSIHNVEEVYQAAKAVSVAEARWVLQSQTPGIAKRRGREVTMVPNWDEIKDKVMRMALDEKFKQNPDLAAKLVATGDATLIEGNHWGDTYWGICKGVGQNKLGLMLMEIRDGLSKPESN